MIILVLIYLFSLVLTSGVDGLSYLNVLFIKLDFLNVDCRSLIP